MVAFALINAPAANSDLIPKLATHWLTDPTPITIEFLPNVPLIARLPLLLTLSHRPSSYCNSFCKAYPYKLFPTKTRYHFYYEFIAVFLLFIKHAIAFADAVLRNACKPDKFCIKFWILADVETKYCYNVLPYLGKDETRTTGLGTHVVMKLAEPLYGKGFNIIVDNIFTNKTLAEKLLEQCISITGTVRADHRELPPINDNLQLHDSVFFQSGNIHLTRYQAKAKKVVHIMSAQHTGTQCQVDGKR